MRGPRQFVLGLQVHADPVVRHGSSSARGFACRESDGSEGTEVALELLDLEAQRADEQSPVSLERIQAGLELGDPEGSPLELCTDRVELGGAPGQLSSQLVILRLGEHEELLHCRRRRSRLGTVVLGASRAAKQTSFLRRRVRLARVWVRESVARHLPQLYLERGCQVVGSHDPVLDEDGAEPLPGYALFEQRVFELLLAHETALDE